MTLRSISGLVGPRSALVICLLALTSIALAVPTSAATIDRTFPFELDKWYDLDVSDGPITIHRVRVEGQKGSLKSKVFRGTNTEFITDVQIQVEYTNDSSSDADADLDIVWVDAQGREIDGYRDEEGMDEDERDEMTAAISTSKYGLEMAKKLIVKIRF